MDRPLEIVADAKPAIAEQRIVGLSLDRPEAETMLPLAGRDAGQGGVDLFLRRRAIQMGGDSLGIAGRQLDSAIPVAPRPDDQSLGLGNNLTH
jgi:hypothetical protein